MAVDKPLKVKPVSIASSDIVSFDAGLDERGDYNTPPNAFTFGQNVMVNSANNITKRFGTKKWLPDSVGFNGEVSTVYYGDELYHFIADDGVVKYCQEGDTSWTTCGGDNEVTTTAGVMTTFLRANDWLLVLNNSDYTRYIDLSTLDMTQFTFVADPTSTITAAATGITASGGFTVYYGFTYSSDGGGETAVGPILSQAVSKSRSTWKSDGTEYLTLTFGDTPPADATGRNLYMAIALNGTTPVASDLALLKKNIPTTDTTFKDDGTLQPNIAYAPAPDQNSTRGIKAASGLMVDKTPVLYNDPDNPYNLYFGGLTDDGVSFGPDVDAQVLPLLKGTDYYPTSVIGFRNNQNVPSLLALFSGTKGTSKQQTLSQKTITYGNASYTGWGTDELNSGASAVYSPYGVVVYLGELMFPGSEGVTSIKTEASLQNVLQPSIVSQPVTKTYGTIKNEQFDKIVASAWNGLVAFTIPSRGYNYNNQMLIRDMNNPDKPKWYVWDMIVDWVGTISPPNSSSFMYIRQGNKFFKLVDSYVAQDENSDGTLTEFPMRVDTTLKAFSNGRNSFFATVQAVIYLANFIGSVDVTVTYLNQDGESDFVTETITSGSGNIVHNTQSGWGNPRLVYRSWNNRVIGWSTPVASTGALSDSAKITKRHPISLPNPVINEAKISIVKSAPNTTFDFVMANFEGVNIGVLGDIR